MENNINKGNQDNKNPIKKYTPKKKTKTISDKELNERLTSLLKEESEKIQPINKELHFKVTSEEEEKERLRKKYIDTGDISEKNVEEILDKLLSDIKNLSEEETIEESETEDSEEKTEGFSQEDMDIIVKKINEQISKLNSEFYSLIKEEEVPTEEIKIKVSKPKSIKIPKDTYKKIKEHCKEHNVDVADWIEKITLNEINRIIIRLGDLNYKLLKKKKEKKEKKKKKEKSI